MSIIVVDTDILIDVARGIQEAIDSLEKIENSSIPAVSVITQMELIVGCRNKSELSALDIFLKRFQILRLNEDISTTALHLLTTYRLSHGLLIPDALIAATSISHSASLISKNQRDFKFITELNLLAYP